MNETHLDFVGIRDCVHSSCKIKLFLKLYKEYKHESVCLGLGF